MMCQGAARGVAHDKFGFLPRREAVRVASDKSRRHERARAAADKIVQPEIL